MVRWQRPGTTCEAVTFYCYKFTLDYSGPYTRLFIAGSVREAVELCYLEYVENATIEGEPDEFSRAEFECERFRSVELIGEIDNKTLPPRGESWSGE